MFLWVYQAGSYVPNPKISDENLLNLPGSTSSKPSKPSKPWHRVDTVALQPVQTCLQLRQIRARLARRHLEVEAMDPMGLAMDTLRFGYINGML